MIIIGRDILNLLEKYPLGLTEKEMADALSASSVGEIKEILSTRLAGCCSYNVKSQLWQTNSNVGKESDFHYETREVYYPSCSNCLLYTIKECHGGENAYSCPGYLIDEIAIEASGGFQIEKVPVGTPRRVPDKPIVSESDVNDIEDKIIGVLGAYDGIKARKIASILGVRKRTVNHFLYGRLRERCWKDSDYNWYLRNSKYTGDTKQFETGKIKHYHPDCSNCWLFTIEECDGLFNACDCDGYLIDELAVAHSFEMKAYEAKAQQISFESDVPHKASGYDETIFTEIKEILELYGASSIKRIANETFLSERKIKRYLYGDLKHRFCKNDEDKWQLRPNDSNISRRISIINTLVQYLSVNYCGKNRVAIIRYSEKEDEYMDHIPNQLFMCEHGILHEIEHQVFTEFVKTFEYSHSIQISCEINSNKAIFEIINGPVLNTGARYSIDIIEKKGIITFENEKMIGIC